MPHAPGGAGLQTWTPAGVPGPAAGAAWLGRPRALVARGCAVTLPSPRLVPQHRVRVTSARLPLLHTLPTIGPAPAPPLSALHARTPVLPPYAPRARPAKSPTAAARPPPRWKPDSRGPTGTPGVSTPLPTALEGRKSGTLKPFLSPSSGDFFHLCRLRKRHRHSSHNHKMFINQP